MIPGAIGDSAWETSLWPKSRGYIVPVKTWVRKAESLVGEVIAVRLTVSA